ncbi:MAG TPA: hypothetical protein EYP79_01650 [Campylobacterales bacterium]|nr:hypothetical protein [Campylobacterales bacterium]
MDKLGVSILKALFLTLIAILNIFAYEIENRIYKEILLSLYNEKKEIKVWSNNKNLIKIEPKRIILVKDPKEADILILNKYENINIEKPIFVTKYHLLKRYKKIAIGGFYWQKGRPNIVFLKSNLKKFNINLPKQFHIFVEDL